jgi:hypothetical protein
VPMVTTTPARPGRMASHGSTAEPGSGAPAYAYAFQVCSSTGALTPT